MIDERDIRTFVNGTTRYFEVAAQQPASLGLLFPAFQLPLEFALGRCASLFVGGHRGEPPSCSQSG